MTPFASGIEIVVDYTYDTEGFFSDPIRRTAMEAVADRYSRVITSELTAVAPMLDQTPWRIGFEHPGTGEPFQISTAANRDSDPLFSVADNEANVYGFSGLDANQWILYAGGRNLVSAGVGGTATGLNFNTIFDDLDGPLHRGVISNTPDNTAGDLPAWGGAISFSLNENWHFDLDETAGNGSVDFYTIAMHEVAHALGLSTQWNQWTQQTNGTAYQGANALAAYNTDNDASLTELSLAPGADPHWQDGIYLSQIFQLGVPNLVGTVGDGLQDLLLEPVANFSTTISRFELTNVDAGALVDIGWSILEEEQGDPLDLNGDGNVNPADVDLACSAGNELQPYFSALASLQGDVDFNSNVGFSDFLTLSRNFGLAANYSSGDINCDASVGFDDFLILSSVFGESHSIAPVPEPSSSLAMFAYACIAAGGLRLRRRVAGNNNPSARS